MDRARYVGSLSGAFALAIAAAGCSGISYNHDFDPAIDFSGLRTYAWAQAEAGQSTAQLRGLDELSERRVIAAVERELEARGLTKNTSGKPDVVVNFYLTTQDKIDVNTYYTGWGYHGWWGGGMGATTTTVNQWTE